MPWYDGPTLLETLESLQPANTASALPFRLPVQLVQRTAGERAYLGRIQSGCVRIGDELIVLPSERRVTVSGVRTNGGASGAALAGDSVALTLAEETDIGRGDLLADAEQPPRVSQVVDATLIWLSAQPLVEGGRYLLKHAARTVRAKLTAATERVDVQTLAVLPAPGRIGLNDIVRVKLAVQQPVAIDAYEKNRAAGAFILIDESTNHTIAGGMAFISGRG